MRTPTTCLEMLECVEFLLKLTCLENLKPPYPVWNRECLGIKEFRHIVLPEMDARDSIQRSEKR